jgi:fatty-acyl-CoA synthase
VSAAVHCLGGTVVVMERFDALGALHAIERYQATSSQWVPTMFVRMLKLDPAERQRFDVSSLRIAVHAAAPCPIEVKQQMIEWWGPILYEYYGGTENIGTTALTSEEWLEHKGSVGRPVFGTVHICDESGHELPLGQEGQVYFDTPEAVFEYHHDPEKTSGVRNLRHPEWRTLGDIGRLDADGYLYLTDRKAYMIIAGGVNIYPQEIEDVLVMHPAVLDAAVFGVPNTDLGEEVKAVVQTRETPEDADALQAELIGYCRQHLAAFKCPRSIDFTDQLPRLDNGKLYKRRLRDPYWHNTSPLGRSGS